MDNIHDLARKADVAVSVLLAQMARAIAGDKKAVKAVKDIVARADGAESKQGAGT